MKHLKYILPVFLSVALISACAPNSEEKEDEVYNEEPISTELLSIEDSAAISDVNPEDSQADETVEDEVLSSDEDKNKSATQSETSQEKVKTKKTSSVTINRKVGVKLKAENEFDLMSFAAEEVAILKKEDCEGENCGNKVQLQNYNSEKEILAVVMIKWKEDAIKKSELREYKLKPESLLDIGCSHSCDENYNKYTWKIVSAKYN